MTIEERVLNAQMQTNTLTLGSDGDAAAYVTDPKVSIQANILSNTPTYELTDFGFGRVYTENGNATSQYFANFTNIQQVTFTTNFQGMGLPSLMYT